jgi:hypothetical protein
VTPHNRRCRFSTRSAFVKGVSVTSAVMRVTLVAVLLSLALIAGASVGAIAKFGLGYDLSIDSQIIKGRPRKRAPAASGDVGNRRGRGE